MRQDDPKKCTAAKLVRLGLASQIRGEPRSRSAIVLDPYSGSYLMRADARRARSVVAIDCSWRLASREFGAIRPQAVHKKLPPMLAGNPVNYSKMHKLTTAEAIAGALFVMGRDGQAHELLSKFAWGHTFYELNSELFAEYARISEPSEIPPMLAEYGLAEAALGQ